VKIRRATPKDASKVAELWNIMIRDTLSTFTTVLKDVEAIEHLISSNEAFFVAEISETVVGFATYSQYRTGPGYAFSMEHSIVVDDAHQGQTIGKQLIKTIEENARANGVRTMIGGFSSTNPKGQAFHAALGYKKAGHLKEVGYKNGQWLDLIFMQKRL